MTSLRSDGFAQRVKRMCTKFPVRDTRYLTAIFFLLGAIFFTINGFIYVFATTEPTLAVRPLALPASSCIGDIFFIFGCTFAIFEALNDQRVTHDDGDVTELALPNVQEQSQKGDVETGVTEKEKEKTMESREQSLTTSTVVSNTVLIGDPNFTWVPSGKHFRDASFIASLIWFLGIIFFTIGVVAYIPGVADLTDVNTFYYLALLPTFFGGFFFLVAALINTVLTQRKWYIPAVKRLSWYVGFWYAVGSLGFALGGCIWYVGEDAYWAATIASFWGAWGWVIGSTLCWYRIMGDY